MREAFSNSLVKIARENTNVVLLTGDHGYALFDEFRRLFPGQYINAGVAEQNMVGIAAGLARSGFRPIVYGLSAFVPIRVLEQIKLDVAHDHLPVIFIGDGAGFVYSHLGTSHQSTEDIACTRAIPNLHVYSPADAHEMTLCMDWAFKAGGPVYLRIGKSDRGPIHPKRVETNLGDLISVENTDKGIPTFIATGSMLKTATDLVRHRHFNANVWSVPCIKPINVAQVTEICKESSAVVTFEEHSIYGGLGSLVCEIASQYAPSRVLRLGVNDRFSELCGSYEYLLSEHQLDMGSLDSIVRDYLAS